MERFHEPLLLHSFYKAILSLQVRQFFLYSKIIDRRILPVDFYGRDSIGSLYRRRLIDFAL